MAARRRPGRLCRLAAGDRSEDSANHKLHQCVCPDHRMPQLAHRGLAQVALVLAVALDPVLGRCPAPSQFDRIFWVRSRSRLPAPKHGRLPGPGIFHLRRLQLGLDSAGCPMPEATPCPKRRQHARHRPAQPWVAFRLEQSATCRRLRTIFPDPLQQIAAIAKCRR